MKIEIDKEEYDRLKATEEGFEAWLKLKGPIHFTIVNNMSLEEIKKRLEKEGTIVIQDNPGQ